MHKKGQKSSINKRYFFSKKLVLYLKATSNQMARSYNQDYNPYTDQSAKEKYRWKLESKTPIRAEFILKNCYLQMES